MRLLGPWTVHDNFQITGVKPPLQYWFNALTLPRLEDHKLAVRIWPLIYGILTAAALGYLAFVVDSTRPWLIALSVGLLLSCSMFLRTAGIGTLDSGLLFYTTLLIVFAQRARTRPGWWLAVGLVCSLGALQKVPLILLVWAIIVFVRLRNPPERQTLKTWWLFWAFVSTVCAIAIWPSIQILHYGLSADEVLRLHEPLAVAMRRAGVPYLDVPRRLVTTWLCGGPALAAAFLLPFLIKNKARNAATELSFLSLLIVALCILSNTRQVNYLGPILPCLCLILAFLMCWMREQGRAIYTAAFLAVLILAMEGWVVTQLSINHDRKDHWKYGVRQDISAHAQIARQLATRQNTPRRLVVVEADNHMLPEEFYLFYGDLNSHLANYTIDQIRQAPPAPPLVGISTTEDLLLIQKNFRPARSIDTPRTRLLGSRLNERNRDQRAPDLSGGGKKFLHARVRLSLPDADLSY